MSVYQLFYVSATSSPYGSNVVKDILRVSRRNNWRLDVTGCLLFSGRHFGQVLEGSKPVVVALAARIAADARHERVRVLSEATSATRFYNDWAMGYLHDLSLEDELERWLDGEVPDTAQLHRTLQRIRPDTVMGAL